MTSLSCPVCHGAFREVLRDGILIDVCTQCKGVWLDRGELDKLLALTREEGYFSPSRSRDVRSEGRYEEPSRRPEEPYREYGKKPYRKKSKLEALFDFFD